MHRMFASLTILLTSWLSPSIKGSWTLVFPLFSSVVVLDRSLRRICRLITLFTNFLLYPFSTMIVRIVSSSRSRMAFELHTLKARSTKHLMEPARIGGPVRLRNEPVRVVKNLFKSIVVKRS